MPLPATQPPKHLQRLLAILALALASGLPAARAQAAKLPAPGAAAIDTARYAVDTYRDETIACLAELVRFNTVANPNIPLEQNPQHIGFKRYLKAKAERLGFDFADYGAVVVIGTGNSTERLGIIAHGDVQPVDAAKWARSPFELDAVSEPGRLLARGTEDDKGPIATALYGMKAIKDRKLALRKRLELYIYMAEESDWAPLERFVASHSLPKLNITLDAEYPVVVAEKGYGAVKLTVPPQPAPANGQPVISRFGGGFFASQIPEDASATISHATPALEDQIRRRAAGQTGMHYQFTREDDQLLIKAHGVSTHSSKPEFGINAISMLADALDVTNWPPTTAGMLVTFLNGMVGTGYLAEKFGAIAYSDSFMGPMTFAPTVITDSPAGLSLNINLRRPQGKSSSQLSEEIQSALKQWQSRHVSLDKIALVIGDPWIAQEVPQADVLLGIFSHFTGAPDPKAKAIGGSTNSRLFPHAISFGPGMPGEVYTGHSEHEFITTKQLLLNLQMYTAAFVELAK